MTNQCNSELIHTVLQLLTKDAPEHFADTMRILIDEAMLQERSAVFQAQPCERTENRLGRANRFKPKTPAFRCGRIDLRIPQVRDGVPFYPSAPEKGSRGEQALSLAMGEMDVQGVSTRKVSAIFEELCGHSVSSTQVSNSAAKLNSRLQAWRERPLSAFSCLHPRWPLRESRSRHPVHFQLARRQRGPLQACRTG